MNRILNNTVALLALLLLLNILVSDKVAAGSSITTDKPVYSSAESIRIHFSGAPGGSHDWICIVPTGTPDNQAGREWNWIPSGLKSGDMTFPALKPGSYEARAYYNYKKNGYVVSARQDFKVVDANQVAVPEQISQQKFNQGYTSNNEELALAHNPDPRKVAAGSSITTDKPVYSSVESIRVHFSGAPGESHDWICIVPTGTPDNQAGRKWNWIPSGLKSGDMTFPALKPGSYEARAYYNYKKKGYVVSARQDFKVVDVNQVVVTEKIPQQNLKQEYSVNKKELEQVPDLKLKQAQIALTNYGYNLGSADGILGRKTQNAIRQFQRDNNLTATGYLNRETLIALNLADSDARASAVAPKVIHPGTSTINSGQVKPEGKIAANDVEIPNQGYITSQSDTTQLAEREVSNQPEKTSQNNSEQFANSPIDQMAGTFWRGKVKTNTKLRSEPTAMSSVLIEIPEGSVVEVSAEDNKENFYQVTFPKGLVVKITEDSKANFYKVTFQGLKGFVNKDLIDKENH
jgi:hypothetical protein